ncbi:DUF192 domain-containing protein [Aquimarina rhabdastrellae]
MKKISYHLILLSFFICLSSCKETSSKEEQITTQKIEFKKEGELTLKRNDSILKQLDIEIADDDYQIQTGLMYRTSMATQQGMLFMFNDSDIRYFYMKNTLIPLDIIYINKNKEIVSIQKNAKPLDETTLPSEAPAMYVLEINGGLSDQWGLQKGDKVSFNTF